MRRCVPSLAATEGERDRFRGLYEGIGAGSSDAQGKVVELTGKLDAEKRLTARALAQVEVLNQQIAALRRQLARSRRRSSVFRRRTRNRRPASPISASGSMSRWRSACRSSRAIARTSSGDCAPSSATGPTSASSATVSCSSRSCSSTPARRRSKPEGRAELDKLAAALLEVERKIPGEIAWVLRVDGHTDVRPINSPQFKSNWELSAARAISVVQYLIGKGVSPQRLVAAGFGEFQPIDTDKTDEAFSRNRRIELKLTER